MRLLSFRVSKFRNVIDSGDIAVDQSVTCLVGKNEAGKSGLLEALYLFNPAYGETLNVEEQYPRWLVVQDRKRGDLDEHSPIKVTLALEAADLNAVDEQLGKGVVLAQEITVSRKYQGGRVWSVTSNEAVAVKNLLDGLPKLVAAKLKGIKTVEDLNAALSALVADDENGPTSSEIRAAKAEVQRRGLENGKLWDPILKALLPCLPKFFRFTNYSTLPGRIDFNELKNTDDEGPGRSGLQTARALLSLAGTDLSQLGNEDYELRKGELEAVQIDLTNQVFEFWKQNPDLEVLIDVDKETIHRNTGHTAVSRFLDVRLRDKRTGYSNNFSQRSSGFQWFFSFLAAFSEFEGKQSPVVLLDEPALTLHGKAQGDFLRFINERLAANAPVLYTTHSPFMVESGHLDRVRIVEDHGPPVGSTVTREVLGTDPDSLFPLQAALGYDIAQNLFVGPNNLVVEGTSDFIYLTLMSQIVVKSGRSGLDSRWRILPAGSAANIPTFVSLVGPHLDVTVLADSDTKGMQRVMSMIERKLLDKTRLIFANSATASANADIEDVFSEGDYLKLFNKTFGKAIKLTDLPKGDRIVKRIESYVGEQFVHGEVAETLLRSYQDISFTDTTLDRFAKLNEMINATINS